MSYDSVILITGANGEVGHGLIQHFAQQPSAPDIITLDLHALDDHLVPLVKQHYQNDILDENTLQKISATHAIDTIFHLAALLSTSGEKNPRLAHDVNVNGTQHLLDMAVDAGEKRGRPVKFIFPSSIAVYGLPDVSTKQHAGAITEDHYLTPMTMYGINKLYCENLGRYYTRHYQQLAEDRPLGVDFRSVRFPGLISALTMPSGGTSDYGPEMIHAAAQGQPYTCFVRPDTTLPFMSMPDGIGALVQLAQAPRAALTQQVYNVTSFSLSASDFADVVMAQYPTSEIRYRPDFGRQTIVDSWAADLDDAAARADWGWSPQYDQEATFHDYLFPQIQERYALLEHL